VSDVDTTKGEYLKTSYMSSFLVLKGNLNSSENTWRHHICLCFSCRKVIRTKLRIPEDIIHVFVSHVERCFEPNWEYLKTSYMASFLITTLRASTVHCTCGYRWNILLTQTTRDSRSNGWFSGKLGIAFPMHYSCVSVSALQLIRHLPSPCTTR